MGTRSTISIANEDGTVTGIYCHWDGYLSNNGEILYNHYNSEDKARELIALGHLSSLRPEIGEKHPFDNPFKWGTDEHREHDARYRNWCMAYGRDRGEPDQDAETFPSLKEFHNAQAQEYNYHFMNGEWYVEHGDSRFVKLGALLKESFTV